MMFNTEVIVKDMKGGKEDMTENKRFRLGYVCGDYGLIDNDEWIDFHSMSENSEKNVKLCINKMNELAEENEQLKSTIKEVIELLSEEVDLFIDKATEYDINACIKLKELDNKDAFYMAIATKKAIKMLKELK